MSERPTKKEFSGVALNAYLSAAPSERPRFLTYLAERAAPVAALEIAKVLDLDATRLGELISVYSKTGAIELAGEGFAQTVSLTEVGRELAKVE